MITPKEAESLFSDDRQKAYKTARAYADGNFKDLVQGEWASKLYKLFGIDFSINFAGLVPRLVERAMSMRTVTVADPEREEGDEPSALEKAAQKDLNKLLKDNRWRTEVLGQAFSFVFREGDAYLVVWEGDEVSPGEPGDPVIFVVAPQSGRMVYSAKRSTKPEAFVHLINPGVDPEELTRKRPEGEKAPEPGRMEIYDLQAEKLERWVQDPEAQGQWVRDMGRSSPAFVRDDEGVWVEDKAGQRIPIFDEQGKPTVEWPVPFPTDGPCVFHLRTCAPYGEPSHLRAYGAQNIISTSLSGAMNVLQYAIPMLIALVDPEMRREMVQHGNGQGADAGAMDAIFGSMSAQDEAAKGPINEKVDYGPGRFLEIMAKALHQAQTGDPAAHLAMQLRALEGLAAVCEIDLNDVMRAVGVSPSKDTRRASHQTFNQMTGDHQEWLSEPIAEATWALMTLFEESYAVLETTPEWNRDEQLDPTEEWDIAGQQIDAFKGLSGLPRLLAEKVLVAAGYDGADVTRMAQAVEDAAKEQAEQAQAELEAQAAGAEQDPSKGQPKPGVKVPGPRSPAKVPAPA